MKPAPALLVKRIEQIDPYTFMIEWSDGKKGSYRLSDMQKICPCAGCVDERTGCRISDPKSVPETLQATKITSVGRYALRIFFTSGCNNGIFGFDVLHDLAKK